MARRLLARCHGGAVSGALHDGALREDAGGLLELRPSGLPVRNANGRHDATLYAVRFLSVRMGPSGLDWKGGGHNSAGIEAGAMRAYARTL